MVDIAYKSHSPRGSESYEHAAAYLHAATQTLDMSYFMLKI